MNRLVNLALGIFGVYSGGKALASGLGLVDEDAPPAALPGGRVHAPPSSGRLRGRASTGRGKDEIRVEVHDVKNLDQRVGYIVKMLQKSRTDGTVRKLAMKILTRQVNGKWAVPEKDWTAEVVAIFTYCQKNLRYVRDPHGIDLFSHAKRTIEWKGGDCLPGDTLLMTRNRGLARLDTIVAYADEIWGLDDFTTVTSVWEKGKLPVSRVHLANGKHFFATPDHKVFVDPLATTARRITVRDLAVGMGLSQPPRDGIGLVPVTKIDREVGVMPTYDIATLDHRVYLPEAGVTVSNCDDKGAITLGALLLAAGYPIRLRVIQTVDSPDWNHIYLLVLLPPGGGPDSRWVPLDATVQRPAGWEAPKRYIKRIRDFRVV